MTVTVGQSDEVICRSGGGSKYLLCCSRDGIGNFWFSLISIANLIFGSLLMRWFMIFIC